MSTGLTTPERLELFAHRVKELNERRLVRNGLNLKFTISWEAASQLLSYQAPRIDEEDLRSFLLTFRQFVSKKEPVFIDRVFNDCLRFLRSDHYKEQLDKARQEWRNSFNKMGPISITNNKKKLTGEFVLDLWINGHYFHNDADKAAELRRLLGDSIPLVRMKFLDCLAAFTQIILYVGAVVEYGLRENLFDFPDNE